MAVQSARPARFQPLAARAELKRRGAINGLLRRHAIAVFVTLTRSTRVIFNRIKRGISVERREKRVVTNFYGHECYSSISSFAWDEIEGNR